MVTDPRMKAEEIRKIVAKGLASRYYRVGRTGGWYGGIATCDCTGCNLSCIFCWSDYPREHPRTGRFYNPSEISNILIRKAKAKNYPRVRLSGNEPTIAKEHLLKVIELVELTGLRFILETNGTLIDLDFARRLARFQNLHVRVSLKGANEEEFVRLTGCDGFELQLGALNCLTEAGVSCHAAVMASFSKSGAKFDLKRRLGRIDPYLVRALEEEEVILYPHVEKRLYESGLICF